jgi:hypothetical protein
VKNDIFSISFSTGKNWEKCKKSIIFFHFRKTESLSAYQLDHIIASSKDICKNCDFEDEEIDDKLGY